MSRWLSILALLPLQASATVLAHDTGDTDVTFGLDHCAGDCLAVVFEPPTTPFTVNYVYAVGGPAGAELSLDVLVLDVGSSLYPDIEAVVGGADDVVVSAGEEAGWFEVDLTTEGTPATVLDGRVAVALCFPEGSDPCGTWGIGHDGGPAVVPDGGMLYIDPAQSCSSGVCSGDSGAQAWANLDIDANWLVRAADEPWEFAPGDDDDSAEIPGDDDTAMPDDDTQGSGVTIAMIDPDAIKEGDVTEFTLTGTGFDEDTDIYVANERVLPVDVTSPETVMGLYPDGLEIGTYDVCVQALDGSGDCLVDGLRVVAASGCGGCSTAQGSIGASTTLGLVGLWLLRRRLDRTPAA